jgi:hypothetical protein
MKMVYVAWKLSTMEEWSQDQSCLFQRDYRNIGHNPEKLSWVRVPVKMVSVARKLSMMKEWRQDQKQRPQRQKAFLGSIPSEDGFCS